MTGTLFPQAAIRVKTFVRSMKLIIILGCDLRMAARSRNTLITLQRIACPTCLEGDNRSSATRVIEGCRAYQSDLEALKVMTVTMYPLSVQCLANIERTFSAPPSDREEITRVIRARRSLRWLYILPLSRDRPGSGEARLPLPHCPNFRRPLYFKGSSV